MVMSEMELLRFYFLPCFVVDLVHIVAKVLQNLCILDGVDVREDCLVVLHIFV